MQKFIFRPLALLLALPIISFYSCEKLPETSFTYTPSVNPEAGETVHFKNTTPEANSFQWDFGDGNTSILESPEHLYEEAGTYEVLLTATNDDGDQPKSESLIINEPTILSFFITDSTGTIFFKDAEVLLYTDEEDWDNFEEPNMIGLTDEEGEVRFMNMEASVYYIWAYKEMAGGFWIRGGYTPDLIQNELNSFRVDCIWIPEDATKAAPLYPEAIELIRRES